MKTRKISIVNMSMDDETKVNAVLHDVWGVRNIKVNPQKGEATISYDEKAASFEDFTQAIIDSGFEVKEKE